MVRAILAGRKTQTRRIFKLHPEDDCFVFSESGWPYRSEPDGEGLIEMCEVPYKCPHGKPGDQLWVRESFSCSTIGDIPWYWADGNPLDGDYEKPKPSIHMPRWASRIDLKITNVRVERLQDISEEDAKAEGFKESDDYTPKGAFKKTWDEIYNNWKQNPWVWVVEFEVMK
jgi:hypothetical protein